MSKVYQPHAEYFNCHLLNQAALFKFHHQPNTKEKRWKLQNSSCEQCLSMFTSQLPCVDTYFPSVSSFCSSVGAYHKVNFVPPPSLPSPPSSPFTFPVFCPYLSELSLSLSQNPYLSLAFFTTVFASLVVFSLLWGYMASDENLPFLSVISGCQHWKSKSYPTTDTFWGAPYLYLIHSRNHWFTHSFITISLSCQVLASWNFLCRILLCCRCHIVVSRRFLLLKR